MPNQFQPFNLSSDIISTKTLLHEAIPITGTIYQFATGSYIEENIKNFSHGQFQSVYDYPYLSSSANHIFDLAVGYDESSTMSSSTSIQNSKKINMYNSMAQVLLGYSSEGPDHINEFVERFESDLNVKDDTRLMKEVFFINFSRLLVKDQIKKGSFSISLATGSWEDAKRAGVVETLSDVSASADSGYASVMGGEYGLLYRRSDTGKYPDAVGNIFYQAGIAIITASLFQSVGSLDADSVESLDQDFSRQRGDLVTSAKTVLGVLTGSSISGACNALRHRICNIAFNNTTEINSKIYFCRVPWNKFNYSTNPTYVSGGAIVVKNIAADIPITYMTTIGMYNAAGELMATAKLSEPLRKDPTNELTLRVRLDY
tara:strand:+ start:259 stop:1377 length:1119 start_codon:yes stop_codon:yes gene_type:complete